MTFWDDKLLLGVEKIDAQHRKLVQAVDDLVDACAYGRGDMKISQILHFIFDYTKEHFQDEELLQLQYGYPQLKEHKQMHEAFVKEVALVISDFDKTGPTFDLTMQISKMLINWLSNHISVEDKKIGEYITSRQA